MLEWTKKCGSPYTKKKQERMPRSASQRSAGKYRSLYEYLEKRYANTVVLTFGKSKPPRFLAAEPGAHRPRVWTTGDISSAEAVARMHGRWPAERLGRISWPRPLLLNGYPDPSMCEPALSPQTRGSRAAKQSGRADQSATFHSCNYRRSRAPASNTLLAPT